MQVTWLHVSDFHIRGGDSYDRDVVLRALVKSVQDFRERGRTPDLVFATGDIAHAGKAHEYDLATQFFDALIEAAGVDRRHLFVIPGNHDVDRDLGVGLARTLESREQADSYFNPAIPKLHLTQKQGAFLQWYNRYFDGIRALPVDSTCGPVEMVDVRGLTIGILPLNSALFCQGDDDHEKLWIGRRCLAAALDKLQTLGHPEQPPPEQLQPCRLPVPSHPSCPCAAVRAGGLPAASSAGQPLARGGRADPRRGHQRAGWHGVGGRSRWKRPFDFPIPLSLPRVATL
jgi:hypothetical protein